MRQLCFDVATNFEVLLDSVFLASLSFKRHSHTNLLYIPFEL